MAIWMTRRQHQDGCQSLVWNRRFGRKLLLLYLLPKHLSKRRKVPRVQFNILPTAMTMMTKQSHRKADWIQAGSSPHFSRKHLPKQQKTIQMMPCKTAQVMGNHCSLLRSACRSQGSSHRFCNKINKLRVRLLTPAAAVPFQKDLLRHLLHCDQLLQNQTTGAAVPSRRRTPPPPPPPTATNVRELSPSSNTSKELSHSSHGTTANMDALEEGENKE
mmetsp:Transcript_4521/g.10684  ORF Transcript_4521/g.10684 Transcript_4521/m.10684 type:complete len:217 (+) Transcript_4521:1473-2123(+)